VTEEKKADGSSRFPVGISPSMRSTSGGAVLQQGIAKEKARVESRESIIVKSPKSMRCGRGIDSNAKGKNRFEMQS